MTASSTQVGELFSAWASAAGVALVVASPDGTIDFASDECTDLCGLTAGDHLLAAFHLSEVARAADLLKAMHLRGEPMDFTAHLACGKKIARFLVSRTVDDAGATRAMVGAFRDVTSQGLHERKLEHDVRHDDLTGVLSRSAAITELESRFESNNHAAAVLFVDLDDFKGINDGYGHMVGDQVLKIVAQRIARAVGDGHLVARMGGDEFLVVLDRATSQRQAVELARDINRALDAPLIVGDVRVQQRFSIGVAVSDQAEDHGSSPAHGHEPGPDPAGRTARVRAERLLIEADMAMYVAKRDDVSIAVADASTRLWSTQRLLIERDLIAAINERRIDFHYQPIIDLATGQTLGAEALMRWRHPELGLLPPDLVVERAEIIGCIDDLTRYTANRVLSEWAEINQRVGAARPLSIGINATARQLSWPGFVRAHLEALSSSGLDADCAVIEVVESSEIQLRARAEATLKQLASRNMRIGLDDFGVGYSALAYFTRFPIHAIKIDRSLVSELRGGVSGPAEKLLQGVVRIADDLGAVVLGEGIEDRASAEICRSLGMRMGQGWHFGRALPLDEFCSFARVTRSEPMQA